MSVDFRLPDLGEGLSEAEILAWHVGPGDHVVADQPLLSVETDKAIVEVPSPRSGQIARIHGDVGDRIAVGALLVEFEQEPEESGAIVGELEAVKDDRATVREEAEAVPVDGDAIGPARAPAARATREAASGPVMRASPAARSLARQLGIALESISPGGPDGTIVRSDVERAARGAEAPALEGLRGVRRAMFERMTAARGSVVPATVTGEADVTRWPSDTQPAFRLVRAMGAACREEPRLNAAFDEATQTIRHQASVHLGIAMETEDGLFVPVLRDVAERDPADLKEEIERLKDDVRARVATAAELRDQTITLSNFGAFGGIHASMVVVPPQVAIVGAGKIAPRVVMEEAGVERHRILPLSITFDHRVVTGVEALRFLGALVADLELAT